MVIGLIAQVAIVSGDGQIDFKTIFTKLLNMVVMSGPLWNGNAVLKVLSKEP